MTTGTAHPTQAHPQDTGMHLTTWIASMLGLVAAAIGAWIMLAPDDGTISIFGNSWAASDLTETWGPWLLVIGGAVTAAGMTFAAVRDRQHRASWWLVSVELVAAIIGVAAAVFGIVALI